MIDKKKVSDTEIDVGDLSGIINDARIKPAFQC